MKIASGLPGIGASEPEYGATGHNSKLGDSREAAYDAFGDSVA
jgi:hypothetical protein